MKKFTHAWLAFMAIKRLEDAHLNKTYRKYANSLKTWFMNHKDDVIQGAWYPDMVIKDMANSHVLKLTPSDTAENIFKKLPKTYKNYNYGKNSPLRKKSFTIEEDDNLPDRCESIAHSIIDHLKMQEEEDKGSPVSPTDNQIALLLFMISHYIADAHVPFHCDSRKFSEGDNIHGEVEQEWDYEVKRFFKIDEANERFVYDPKGYPLMNSESEQDYENSFLKSIEEELENRKFIISWGAKNNNVWDFMSALCQYSYLLSYYFIPEGFDHSNVSKANWKTLGSLSFDELSVAVFSDAIDSIARIWLRVWRRYMKWEKKQRSKK